MSVAAAVHGGYLPSQPTKLSATMNNYGRRNRTLRSPPPAPPPIFLSTNPSDVKPNNLRDLYGLCNHSPHRFPNLDSGGNVEPVDLDKLRIALSHSFVVVSVFSKPEVVSYYSSKLPKFGSSSSELSILMGVGGDWLQRVAPVTPSNGRLVGFGRAVSDYGLTASIYDVMCLPGYSFITRNGNWPDDC